MRKLGLVFLLMSIAGAHLLSLQSNKLAGILAIPNDGSSPKASSFSGGKALLGDPANEGTTIHPVASLSPSDDEASGVSIPYRRDGSYGRNQSVPNGLQGRGEIPGYTGNARIFMPFPYGTMFSSSFANHLHPMSPPISPNKPGLQNPHDIPSEKPNRNISAVHELFNESEVGKAFSMRDDIHRIWKTIFIKIHSQFLTMNFTVNVTTNNGKGQNSVRLRVNVGPKVKLRSSEMSHSKLNPKYERIVYPLRGSSIGVQSRPKLTWNLRKPYSTRGASTSISSLNLTSKFLKVLRAKRNDKDNPRLRLKNLKRRKRSVDNENAPEEFSFERMSEMLQRKRRHQLPSLDQLEKDELYHHAIEKGLIVKGPDPLASVIPSRKYASNAGFQAPNNARFQAASGNRQQPQNIQWQYIKNQREMDSGMYLQPNEASLNSRSLSFNPREMESNPGLGSSAQDESQSASSGKEVVGSEVQSSANLLPLPSRQATEVKAQPAISEQQQEQKQQQKPETIKAGPVPGDYRYFKRLNPIYKPSEDAPMEEQELQPQVDSSWLLSYPEMSRSVSDMNFPSLESSIPTLVRTARQPGDHSMLSNRYGVREANPIQLQNNAVVESPAPKGKPYVIPPPEAGYPYLSNANSEAYAKSPYSYLPFKKRYSISDMNPKLFPYQREDSLSIQSRNRYGRLLSPSSMQQQQQQGGNKFLNMQSFDILGNARYNSRDIPNVVGYPSQRNLKPVGIQNPNEGSEVAAATFNGISQAGYPNNRFLRNIQLYSGSNPNVLMSNRRSPLVPGNPIRDPNSGSSVAVSSGNSVVGSNPEKPLDCRSSENSMNCFGSESSMNGLNSAPMQAMVLAGPPEQQALPVIQPQAPQMPEFQQDSEFQPQLSLSQSESGAPFIDQMRFMANPNSYQGNWFPRPNSNQNTMRVAADQKPNESSGDQYARALRKKKKKKKKHHRKSHQSKIQKTIVLKRENGLQISPHVQQRSPKGPQALQKKLEDLRSMLQEFKKKAQEDDAKEDDVEYEQEKQILP